MPPIVDQRNFDRVIAALTDIAEDEDESTDDRVMAGSVVLSSATAFSPFGHEVLDASDELVDKIVDKIDERTKIRELAERLT